MKAGFEPGGADSQSVQVAITLLPHNTAPFETNLLRVMVVHEGIEPSFLLYQSSVLTILLMDNTGVPTQNRTEDIGVAIRSLTTWLSIQNMVEQFQSCSGLISHGGNFRHYE